MKRTASIVTALSIAALASACAGHTNILATDYHSSYHSANFSRYHGGRDTELQVLGEASFGMDKVALGTAVSQAMHGQHFGRAANFTLTPGPSAEKNLYVIMAFNMAETPDLCEEADKLTPQPAAGTTTLQGAWCWSGQTQSYVLVHAPATRPGETTFAVMVGGATRELFRPNPDVEERKDNDSYPP